MEVNLDKIDLSILKLLQENGRKTNVQLSNEIGLSPAPTLERVKKLENSGIIKSYHAVIEENAVDLGIKAGSCRARRRRRWWRSAGSARAPRG